MGILIRIDQILEEKRARHMDTYMKSNPSKRFLLRLKRMITSNKETGRSLSRVKD